MATIISEKLTINGEGSNVVLDGFDFTGNGYVDVKNASAVTIKNCRVYGMNLAGATKNYWLHIYNDIPAKLVVENNFFGSNPTSGSNKMYNLIEPNAKLKNGSSVSDNYFVSDCCCHNFMNIYGCETVFYELSEANNYILDVQDFIAALDSSYDMIILPNPNNPTSL